MRETKFFDLQIAWDDAVYEPNADSILLADGLHAEPGMACLDLCTGTGLAALVMARQAGAAVATDINPHACRIAQHNAKTNDLHLDVICMDLADGLDAPFDRITANVPYLPTAPDDERTDMQARAVEGGKDGATLARRAIEEIQTLLTPEGEAFILASSLQPLEDLETFAQERGLTWDPQNKTNVGRFENLFRVRLTHAEPPETQG